MAQCMGLVRFLLALSVVLWHARGNQHHLLNAAVAVALFFMISGFYMTMVINEKYKLANDGRWKLTFYESRAWRLMPAYWASFCLLLLWMATAGGFNPFLFDSPGSVLKRAVLLFSNLFIVGQDFHQFAVRVLVDHAGPEKMVALLARYGGGFLEDQYMLIGQAWSLAAEISFYLLAPFLVVSGRRTFLAAGTALFIRFLLIGVWGQRSGVWGYFFFPGALSMFLLGACGYHLHRLIPRTEGERAIGAALLVAFVTWLLVGSYRYAGVLLSGPSGSIDEARFWALYIPFAIALPFVFALTKNWRFDRELGELSYPLYLIHGMILGLAFYRWGAPTMLPDLGAAVLFCVSAAYTLNKVIEVPANRLREAWVRRRMKGRATFKLDSTQAASIVV
jgi:peptidoglycan/LPS O-acetylase OafA/YrhL